jgi:hypothetical protein
MREEIRKKEDGEMGRGGMRCGGCRLRRLNICRNIYISCWEEMQLSGIAER